MPRDYYIVLGVDRGADQPQIKSAYRDAIKRHHPDMVGSLNAGKFIEAREAYEVLSDIDKRRAYDAKLFRQEIPPRKKYPEKTIDQRTSAWHAFRGMPSMMDDFFEGFVPGFYRNRSPARSPNKDLYMEILLSPEEAQRGGIFPVTLPVWEPCPECGQSGWWDEFDCPACLGNGAVESIREFKLAIPPHTQHGTTVKVPMYGIGLEGVGLMIDVQVR